MGFEAVEALGITVVPVATLNGDAVMVEGHPVLLVREDVDSVDRDRIVTWVVGKARESKDAEDAEDIARGLRHAEHMLKCLNNLRKRPPVFHHTDAGLISGCPDVTLPLDARTGPGTDQRTLCGMYSRDVWLRGDNPIVLDVLGEIRICRRCAASHARMKQDG
ncbi:hypothetical protein SAMN05216184_108143 [Georgenia satyanarayanai]|uniref:Uncharacterized protein n=2 Tax=Georgenia satyanarayanai TaxID=860221 RepID=A0A2Y9ALW3_9MICO|nr:hypothetical protein A8987_108143 [Georgenia satyanarayanai]SSA43379.1 hypothetical protein SAMN05216184_108143 [Georgenia satyanarayanai]